MITMEILDELRSRDPEQIAKLVKGHEQGESFVSAHQEFAKLIEGLQPYQELTDQRCQLPDESMHYLTSLLVSYHYTVQHQTPPHLAEMVSAAMMQNLMNVCCYYDITSFFYRLGYARAMADFDRPRS